MEPFTMALMMGGGLALNYFGGQKKSEASSRYTAAQVEEINLQQKVEAQRAQQMELDASRQQKEALRRFQRTRAMGLQASVSSGSQFGSGLQGGEAQAHGEAGTNLLGIGQNLQIGRNVFALNNQISQQKIEQANAGKDLQEGNALEGFGKNLMSSMEPFGRLASGFGKSNIPNPFAWSSTA